MSTHAFKSCLELPSHLMCWTTEPRQSWVWPYLTPSNALDLPRSVLGFSICCSYSTLSADRKEARPSKMLVKDRAEFVLKDLEEPAANEEALPRDREDECELLGKGGSCTSISKPASLHQNMFLWVLSRMSFSLRCHLADPELKRLVQFSWQWNICTWMCVLLAPWMYLLWPLPFWTSFSFDSPKSPKLLWRCL